MSPRGLKRARRAVRRCLFFSVAAAPREGTAPALESDPTILG